jgi:hypothetical protein
MGKRAISSLFIAKENNILKGIISNSRYYSGTGKMSREIAFKNCLLFLW